jgi:RND family efflux transporter MFP subunit
MRFSGIFLAFGLLLTSCSGPYGQGGPATAKTEPAPLSVKTLAVAPTTLPEVISANGELFAEEQTTISAKVPGRVQKLYADLGSVLKAGDIVAELEKTEYEFRVRQSEAAVDQIRARLALSNRPDEEFDPARTATVREAAAALKEARFIFETTAKLQKEGVVSRIEFEKAQVRRDGVEAHYAAVVADVMQLRSQLSERRANLALARQQLDDCTIRAPFSGAVTRRPASPGEYLSVNASILTLVRQNPLRVRLEVPERLAARVERGQMIEVRLEAAPVVRTGRVVRLSPAIEAQGRSLVIEGEIPNTDGVLRPGSFVQGTITLNPNAQGIAVPREAVLGFAGTERAFVVKNGALEDRIVKTGRRLDNDRIEVLEGLSAGDRLVSPANDRMTKGLKVREN